MAVKVKVGKQKITKRYAVYQGDCVEVTKGFPDESIGFTIFSPPFSNLYAYSDDTRDMGNVENSEEFFEHFGFLVEELERVMMPGRIVAVHCMDLPIHKSDVGYIGLRDFTGDIIKCFLSHGFVYHSRHCIWKDPLLAAVRTHAIGLAHKQIVKDSAMVRTGIPDYILAFRKRGDNIVPIEHPKGLVKYYGTRTVPKRLDAFSEHEPARNKRSHWIWQQYASPVWFDIDQTHVLPYRAARSKEDQKHICPLQLDVIERCLVLWSAENDKVYSPFMGIGSEVRTAVKNGRFGIGAELKRSYFLQAVNNLRSVSKNKLK